MGQKRRRASACSPRCWSPASGFAQTGTGSGGGSQPPGRGDDRRGTDPVDHGRRTRILHRVPRHPDQPAHRSDHPRPIDSRPTCGRHRRRRIVRAAGGPAAGDGRDRQGCGEPQCPAGDGSADLRPDHRGGHSQRAAALRARDAGAFGSARPRWSRSSLRCSCGWSSGSPRRPGDGWRDASPSVRTPCASFTRRSSRASGCRERSPASSRRSDSPCWSSSSICISPMFSACSHGRARYP